MMTRLHVLLQMLCLPALAGVLVCDGRAEGLSLPASAVAIFAPQPGAADDPMQLSGEESHLGRLDVVTVDGQPFERAYRFETKDAASARWKLQLRGDLSATLDAGRVYLVSLRARCVESTTGDGTFQLKIEQNHEPWTECMSRGMAFGPQWQQFTFPFQVKPATTFAAGQTQLTLHMGAARQIVEVADIHVYSFGDEVSIDALPRSRVSYAGSDPGAAWRQEAAARIDRYRKANLRVVVRDAQGQPVADAQVRIEQVRHAFPFGAAFNLRFYTSGDPVVPQYRDAFLERFNAIVFENELKWHGEGLRNPEAVDAGLAFAQQHRLYTRGHVLVWPGVRFVPEPYKTMIAHLRSNPDDSEARERLRAAVAHRITSVASQLAGRVHDWDVVNEPFSNHDLIDVLDPPGTPSGAGVMVDWFKLARQADPHARLYLNDYGILTAGTANDAHQNAFFDTARTLLEHGAPLDGLGMQGHFGSSLTPPAQLWQILDRFAQLGLEIKVTEFDLNIDDAQLKADYTRDFYTAMFAHPSVTGILSWGFWSRRHWRPDAAYLDDNFSSRPHDVALRTLLFDEWWTRQSLSCDRAGAAESRVFHGRHRVVVTRSAAASIEAVVDVGPQDTSIELQWPE